MDTTKVLIIGAVTIVLGGIGWFAVSQNGGEDAMMEKPSDAEIMEGKDEGVAADKGDTMMGKGSYETYSPEDRKSVV